MIFDWFKSKEERLKDYDIVKPVPYIETPKQEETYYSIGITSENRIIFKVGYSTLTMNHTGCEELIEQLTVFTNQLKKEKND
jgi:hypothetical protein